MRTDEFDFDLDPSLIAQTPIKNRSDSRLLILDKNTGEIVHESFKNIINYYINLVLCKNINTLRGIY